MVSGYTELGCCPENCSHTVYRCLDGGETDEEKEVVTVGAGEITRPDCSHPRLQIRSLLRAWDPSLARYLEARVTAWGSLRV